MNRSMTRLKRYATGFDHRINLPMPDLGKMLVLIGLAVAVLGAIVWGAARFGFRGLPGDIRYESGNARFYFPIVTCIVLSVLLTGLMWMWNYFTRK